MLWIHRHRNRITGRQHVKERGWRRLAPLAGFAQRLLIAVAILAGCLLLSIGVALIGKAYYLFLTDSEYFRLVRARIQTRGVSEEVKEELLAVTGLASPDGVCLLRLDTDHVRDMMLKHPRIRAGSVQKRYPNALSIVGVERQPMAIVSAGGFYFIDEEAVILGKADVLRDDCARFVFLTGIPEGEMVLGKRLETPGLERALDLIAALRALNPSLYNSLSEIYLNERDGLILFLQGGMEARLGFGDPIRALPALELFLKRYPDPTRTEYVDLRFDNQIAYRLRP